jgi:hypothetical protein
LSEGCARRLTTPRRTVVGSRSVLSTSAIIRTWSCLFMDAYRKISQDRMTLSSPLRLLSSVRMHRLIELATLGALMPGVAKEYQSLPWCRVWAVLRDCHLVSTRCREDRKLERFIKVIDPLTITSQSRDIDMKGKCLRRDVLSTPQRKSHRLGILAKVRRESWHTTLFRCEQMLLTAKSLFSVNFVSPPTSTSVLRPTETLLSKFQ